MKISIEESWKSALKEEFDKPYFINLITLVQEAYLNTTVYPPSSQLFASFEHCPLPAVKVVILGQDPYHGLRQAHGLSFSVPEGTVIPPSLQNIYKEIRQDVDSLHSGTGDLTDWAKQGVLLLNSTLTVQAHQAGSHQGYGWEQFTNMVIKTVSRERQHVAFMLWGKFAEAKRSCIDESKHLVLTAPHPSPLSAHRGFFGCQHFSKANQYLEEHGKARILW